MGETVSTDTRGPGEDGGSESPVVPGAPRVRNSSGRRTKATPPRRLEYVDLDAVAPAPFNAKMHDFAALEQSMERFSFTEPVIVDERTSRLVAGHGRVEQLKMLRDKGSAPPEGVQVVSGQWRVPVVRGWSSKDDREAAAYVIASNRITEAGGWDRTALVTALDALEGAMVGVGFDQADLDDLRSRLDQTVTDVSDDEETTWDDPPPPNDEDTGQRTLVLDYDLATFERVVELAGVERKHYGVDSNATLFLRLLEAAVNDG